MPSSFSLSFVGTAGVLYAWYWLVQREDVGRLAVFLFGVPLINLLLALVAFDEGLGRTEVVGIIVALAGILRVLTGGERGGRPGGSAGKGRSRLSPPVPDQ